jgi:hypothetical protein
MGVMDEAVRQMRERMGAEGDRREFELHGYHCLIVRDAAAGYLSGFVGVPRGHGLYGVDHADLQGVTVHGGFEYSGPAPHEQPERPNVWYFGFDCDHLDDICLRDLVAFDPISFGVKRTASYKDMEFVDREVRRLAEELKSNEHFRVYR